MARALNNLAILYTKQGKYRKAKPLYQRALRLQEQMLGAEHALVGIALNNLAELYGKQDRYSEAKALYRKALNAYQHALGSDHPDVAHPLNGLAGIYTAQRCYKQAEPLYQRALSLRETHLGKTHPDTAQTLHDMALLRQQQGQLSEARALAEQALRICAHSLGVAHPQTRLTQALSSALLQEELKEQPGVKIEVQPLPQRASRHQRHPEAAQNLRTNMRHEHRTSFSLHEPVTPPATPCFSEDETWREFLTACCERHPRAWCRSADLWRAYQHWTAKRHERYPLSRGAFIAHLKAQGCRADRTKTARIWRGIALVNNKGDGG